MVLGGIGSIEGGTGRYMMVLGQDRLVLVGTWWYWVSMERYWFIYDGTVSLWGDICWYLVVLDQYRAVMVDTWWYWVSIGQ